MLAGRGLRWRFALGDRLLVRAVGLSLRRRPESEALTVCGSMAGMKRENKGRK